VDAYVYYAHELEKAFVLWRLYWRKVSVEEILRISRKFDSHKRVPINSQELTPREMGKLNYVKGTNFCGWIGQKFRGTYFSGWKIFTKFRGTYFCGLRTLNTVNRNNHG